MKTVMGLLRNKRAERLQHKVAKARLRLLQLGVSGPVLAFVVAIFISQVDGVKNLVGKLVGIDRAEIVLDWVHGGLVGTILIFATVMLLLLIVESTIIGVTSLNMAMYTQTWWHIYRIFHGAHEDILRRQEALGGQIIRNIMDAQSRYFHLSNLFEDENRRAFVAPLTYLLEKESTIPPDTQVLALRPPFGSPFARTAFENANKNLVQHAARGVAFRIYFADYYLNYLKQLKEFLKGAEPSLQGEIIVQQIKESDRLPRYFGVAIYAHKQRSALQGGTAVTHPVFGSLEPLYVDCFLIIPLVQDDAEITEQTTVEASSMCIRVRHRDSILDLLDVLRDAKPA